MGIIIAIGALGGGAVGAGIGTILALIIATVRKSNNKDNSWWLGFVASFAVCAPISGLIGAFVVASYMLNQI
jgi:hypothetical protein